MTRYRNARYLAEINEDIDEDVIQSPDDAVVPQNAEETSFKKRYGDLRRHAQEEKVSFENRIKALEDQLAVAAKAQIKYPKTEAEVAQWMKTYPDVAAILQTLIGTTVDEKHTDVIKLRREIEEQRLEIEQEKAFQRLLVIHPDFAEIRAGDEFHEWAAEQPKWISDTLYNPDLIDHLPIARIVDLYKADIAKVTKQAPNPQSQRQLQRELATNVRVPSNTQPLDGGKRQWSDSAVAKLTHKEYERYEAEIDEAIASGNYLADLSGAR